MGSQVAVTPRGGTSTSQSSNAFVSFFPMVVVCAILYFLVIRPQQKQAKDHRKMVESLKSGDRVLTQGGIYGTVISLKGGIVQVKIADNVRVEMNRSAITQVLPDSSNGVTPAVIQGSGS